MKRISKIKKGGSRASNSVMRLNPKVCMDYKSPVIEGKSVNYKLNDLSLYRTIGGGKRKKNRKGGGKSYKNVSSLGGRPCNATNKLKGGSPTKHPYVSDCKSKALNSQSSQSSQSSQTTQDSEGNGDTTLDVNLVNKKDLTQSTQKINLKGGGSSDWKSTLYSRGPVNNPGMDKLQFKAFSSSENYIPNSGLRTGKFLKGGYSKRNRKRNSKRNSKRNRKRNSKRNRKRNSKRNSKKNSKKNSKGGGSD